jgi:16S rRNA (cytosine967-C5)-methyltransferase
MPAGNTLKPHDVQPGLLARILAVRSLKAVLADRQPFDDSFDSLCQSTQFAQLAGPDRAFARAIAAASLRRGGQIQSVISHFLPKPLPEDAHHVQTILMTGAAQLLFLEMPPHAVVDLSVSQTYKSPNGRRYGGLVNAVLRRIAAEGSSIIAAQDAARLNTPDWLFQSWVQAYGEATAREIASAHLQEPPLDLTIKAGQPAEAWAARLDGRLLPPATVRISQRGRIHDLPGYEEGAWWVQDAAAALPARLFGNIASRLRIADLCAAPGGKTAQLAAGGAEVTAVDISASRLRRLAGNLKRLRLEASIVEADAASWRPEQLYDGILVDAPCSSTGTIRRHPDILHLKSQSDVETLAKLQARLLAHAISLLKPGGTLVYCTCSLQPDEGERQIQSFLSSNDGVTIDPISEEEVNGFQFALTEHGFLRTLPCHLQLGLRMSGLDGFFIARLRVS